MASIAIGRDPGAGQSNTAVPNAFNLDVLPLDDAGNPADAPGGASTVASIMALLVFVLVGGLTALLTIAAQPILGLSMPPSVIFFFGVAGILFSVLAALAMRRAVLRMVVSERPTI